jgi:ribose transport system ATP-binding protein
MYQVELVNISKSFGGIAALKDVSLRIKSGEIHALVGENGAGKSTLMKILSGAYSKDSGNIYIDQKEVQIKNTHDSKKLGIGIIYQEFSLVPELSVAENIFLHQLSTTGHWMNWNKIRRITNELLHNIGFDVNSRTKVRKLSIAQQQIVEIAKALSQRVNVLILDEPSAVLGPIEIQRLFDTLRRLKKEGVSIIYISHHLNEIFQIADRVSILKDGVISESISVAETDKETIIKLMLGRSLDTLYPSRKVLTGGEILKAESLNLGEKVKDVSLTVKEGEVLGIAGLVGSGRTETARLIFGVDKSESGKIFLNRKLIQSKSPYKAKKEGIGMVPEDRKQHGIILSLSVKHNIGLSNFRKISNRFGFISARKEASYVQDLINKFSIKTQNKDAIVEELSGGNQQKVAISKWAKLKNKVMIIDEPTRGVDIGAKVEIYNLINELAHQQLGIILISSETSELIGICDRIIVMRKGRIQGELLKDQFSEEEILRLAIGV